MCYKMNLSKVLDLISINNNDSEIIGSFNDKSLKYWSDIDAQEKVLHMSGKSFVSHIQNIVKEINREHSIYFVDFKMGKFEGDSIHLNKKEILKGEKKLESKKEPISMLELLLEKSIIKLDVSAFVPKYKRFIDFSINYYFLGKNLNTTPDFNFELTVIFKSDFFKKIESGNFMKALKRLYKLADVKDNHKIKRQIEHFLNSDVGKENNTKNIIQTLKSTVELEDFDSWKYFIDEIDEIKGIFYLSKMRNFGNILNKIRLSKNKKLISEELEKIINLMDKTIQPKAEKYLKRIYYLADFLTEED